MRFLIALLGLAAALTCNAQAVVWPSTSTSCSGSLQACVNAQPAYFTVIIATDTVGNVGGEGVGGALNLPRSIWLVAADGYHPQFPIGVGIQSLMSGTTLIQIQDLNLRSARITLNALAGSTVDVDVRRVDIEDNTGNGGFEFQQIGGGSYTLRLEDNHYRRNGGTAAPITVASSGGSFNADIRFNRVEVPDESTSAYGLVGFVSGAGQLNLDLIGNRVLGSFSYGALCGVIGTSSTAAANVRLRALSNVVTPSRRGFGTGVCAFGGEGAMSAYAINNTLIHLSRGIYAGVRPFSAPASPQALTGFIFNNLIAYNGTAVQQQTLAAGMTNDYNLLFDNDAIGSGFVAGSNTVTSDPRLISRERPYLGASSPAIDAGSSSALALAGTPTLPSFDADGHRRFKASAIDIGAWEFGDSWFHVVAPAAPSGNIAIFSHPSVDGQPAARILVTPNFSLGFSSLTDPIGVYQQGTPATWAIYREDYLLPMPASAGFNVFVPATGSGRFLHTLSSSTSSSLLNDSSVNGKTDARVFITHNWNPSGGAGVYNDHPTGVYTYADNNWYAQSGDGFPMPNGAALNVYAQDATPSVFTVDVPAVIPKGVGFGIPIDHPDISPPCTVLMVTPWRSSSDDFGFDVYRSEGRWNIGIRGTADPGTRFNVMYSPRQVFECSGPMFRDGFE